MSNTVGSILEIASRTRQSQRQQQVLPAKTPPEQLQRRAVLVPPRLFPSQPPQQAGQRQLLSGELGISVYHFRNYQTLDELWFVRVGLANFKYWLALESKTREVPSTLQPSLSLGMLILFDPLFFFHHIVPQFFPSIWHFENSSSLLWNPRYSDKGDLPEHFALFLLFCHFHMNLNIQNSWTHCSSTYLWQFSIGNCFYGKALTYPKLTRTLWTEVISQHRPGFFGASRNYRITRISNPI